MDKNSPEYKKYRREISRKHRAKHPKKVRARKVGEVSPKKPCEVCGVLNTEAHHDDYGEPLNVTWLCPLHHKGVHCKATYTSKEKEG